MKTKIYSLTTFIILTCTLAFGQTKYIKTTDGQIVDTITYNKLKASKVEKMKSIFPTKDLKVTIKDNFKEIKKTKDSIIYTYKWDFQIGDPIVKEKKTFDPDDYIGKEFPLPTLKTLDNKSISINDLKGKPTLINFWFTTCKPCIEEMPVLSEIKNQLKDSVNFIAITFEPNERVMAFFKKYKFNFVQIAGAGVVTDYLKMEAFPVNIFLDKKGIVRKIASGIPYFVDDKNQMKMGDGKEFVAVLRELL